MKTAKELLELRNKLEKDYKECVKKEWDNIENTIDTFKITKECEYIQVPKIESDENKNVLLHNGFFIWDYNDYSRLYFDEDSYNLARRHCHEFIIPRRLYEISADKTSLQNTVESKSNEDYYDSIVNNVKNVLAYTK